MSYNKKDNFLTIEKLCIHISSSPMGIIWWVLLSLGRWDWPWIRNFVIFVVESTKCQNYQAINNNFVMIEIVFLIFVRRIQFDKVRIGYLSFASKSVSVGGHFVYLRILHFRTMQGSISKPIEKLFPQSTSIKYFIPMNDREMMLEILNLKFKTKSKSLTLWILSSSKHCGNRKDLHILIWILFPTWHSREIEVERG